MSDQGVSSAFEGGMRNRGLSTHRVKQPGDILMLSEPLRQIEADCYVLLSIGDSCILARAGVNENGRYTVTSQHVSVTLADLCYFLPTGVRVLPFEE